MSLRLFFGLLLGLLFFWFCAGVCTTLWTNQLYSFSYCEERWFGRLLHSFFILAIMLTLWFGRMTVKRFKLALILILLLFSSLLYISGVWPSILAAFVRAPWANENERGPTMSAPSDYSIYTWECEVGPKGVKE